jgi:hypothetical protein
MDRSFSAGAHSEENARDKEAPTRRERVAAMERRRVEFIMLLLYVVLEWLVGLVIM